MDFVAHKDGSLQYSVLNQKPYEVTLWCYASLKEQGIKRPNAEVHERPSKAPKKSYDKHVDKMAQAEEIEDKLREKYKDNYMYSSEQL